MHSVYMDRIKYFEGFSARASWDYAQHTNGYGTKALHPGESISREEAQRRFEAEIAEAQKIVDKNADGWDAGTKAALTSLTFNAGPRWIKGGLGEAVRAHDVDAVRQRFMEYNKAQGKVLPGLVSRRGAEAAWIGQSAVGAEPHDAAVAAAPVSTPAPAVTPVPCATNTDANAQNRAIREPTYRTVSTYRVGEYSTASLEALRQPLLEALLDMQLKLIQSRSPSSRA